MTGISTQTSAYARREVRPAYPVHVLRDYALLADGERGVLAGPRGEHAWLCAPMWDAPAVFSPLIGGRGLYPVTPVADGRLGWTLRAGDADPAQPLGDRQRHHRVL